MTSGTLCVPLKPAPFSELAPREQETIILKAAGLPDKAIASALGISIHTVELYLQRARLKCHAETTVELVRKCFPNPVLENAIRKVLPKKP